MVIRLSAFACFATLLLALGLAEAGCPDGDRAGAATHVKAGRDAAGLGDHSEALSQFEAAYGLCPDGWLLPYVASSRARVGQYVLALDTMAQFEEAGLALPPVPRSDDDSVDARRARQRIVAFQEMDAMRRYAARQVATLVVTGVPADASITADGVEIPSQNGVATLRRDSARVVVVVVSAPGRDPIEQQVELNAGATTEIRSFLLSANTTPAPLGPTPAGENGGLSWVGLTVTGIGIIPLALGVAGVVDAGSTSTSVQQQRAQIDEECGGSFTTVRCAERNSIVDANESALDDRRTLGWIGVATGGAITATGIILTLVLSGGDEGENTGEAGMSCAPGLGSVSCRGRF